MTITIKSLTILIKAFESNAYSEAEMFQYTVQRHGVRMQTVKQLPQENVRKKGGRGGGDRTVDGDKGKQAALGASK